MLLPPVFSVLRISPDGSDKILTLNNVKGRGVTLNINTADMSREFDTSYDLFSEKENVPETHERALTLQPYDAVWLKAWG